MPRLGSFCAALVLVLPSLAGCTADRKLMISEVGFGVLELYLDEPPDHTLDLSDHVLEVRTRVPDPANPMQDVPYERSFELWGTLAGGQYLVIWEQPGRTGMPAYEQYENDDEEYVTAIAVEPGTLGPAALAMDGTVQVSVDNTRPYSFRVHGKHTRYVFPFFYAQDVTDDVVTLGPRPRPEIGGAFTETGALDAVARRKAIGLTTGQSAWRKTRNTPGGDVPKDGDTEDDWRQDDENLGRAN
jgi:hypothetical protein